MPYPLLFLVVFIALVVDPVESRKKVNSMKMMRQQSISKKVEDLLGQMTLTEKIGNLFIYKEIRNMKIFRTSGLMFFLFILFLVG